MKWYKDGYCVSEVEITNQHILANKSLRQSRPSDHGIIILGIQRADANYIGAPGPEDDLGVGDVATIYGKEDTIKNLSHRK